MKKPECEVDIDADTMKDNEEEKEENIQENLKREKYNFLNKNYSRNNIRPNTLGDLKLVKNLNRTKT